MSSQFRLESYRVLSTLTTNLSGKTQAVVDAIFTKRGRLPDLNHTRKRVYRLSLVLRARGGDRMTMIESARARGNLSLADDVTEELEISKELMQKIEFCESWAERMIPSQNSSWSCDSEEYIVLKEMLKCELCENVVSKHVEKLCGYATTVLKHCKSSDLCSVLMTIEMILTKSESRSSSSTCDSIKELNEKLLDLMMCEDINDANRLGSLRCVEKLLSRINTSILSVNKVSQSIHSVVKQSRNSILRESSAICEIAAKCLLSLTRRCASEFDPESCTTCSSVNSSRFLS